MSDTISVWITVFHSPLLAFSDFDILEVESSGKKNRLRWKNQHLSGKVLRRFGKAYDDCFATYQNVSDENAEADYKDYSISELLTPNCNVENINEWAK